VNETEAKDAMAVLDKLAKAEARVQALEEALGKLWVEWEERVNTLEAALNADERGYNDIEYRVLQETVAGRRVSAAELRNALAAPADARCPTCEKRLHPGPCVAHLADALPEHRCGVQGFDGMKGDVCPACEQAAPQPDKASQGSTEGGDVCTATGIEGGTNWQRCRLPPGHKLPHDFRPEQAGVPEGPPFRSAKQVFEYFGILTDEKIPETGEEAGRRIAEECLKTFRDALNRRWIND